MGAEPIKALTPKQMGEADRRCIEEIGIPGAVLMSHAGAAIFAEVPEGPVGVVCGKGNNGGDGYVVARLALMAGMSPHVVVAAEDGEVQGDARTFLNAYRRLGGHIVFAPEPEPLAEEVACLADCRVLVDALLGTGFRGAVREPIRAAIEAWPAGVFTVAVDVPSGLNAETGQAAGPCVRADVTVTMQFPKSGFHSVEAAPYLGRLVVADIGIPPVCADNEAWDALRATWNPAWDSPA